MSFFSHTISTRIGQNNRLVKLEKLIDWSKIKKQLEILYEGKKREVGGVKPYNSLGMYKAILLQSWYSLSDPELEEAVKLRIDFMTFTGFSLDSFVPDETTFCRFRNKLVDHGLDLILMKEINNQLTNLGLTISKSNGAILDATIVESAARPKKQIEIEEDRNEKEEKQKIKIQESCDPDAKWLKKGKRCFFGYKVFAVAQEKYGFIEHIEVTPANQSEMTYFPKVIEKLKFIKKRRIYGDKGFSSKNNRMFLKEKKYKDGIMEKRQKNKELSKFQKIKNKLISKKRFIVEQGFGTMKRILEFTRAKYMTKRKVEGEAIRKAICHNLIKATNKIKIIPKRNYQEQILEFGGI